MFENGMTDLWFCVLHLKIAWKSANVGISVCNRLISLELSGDFLQSLNISESLFLF